MTRDCELLCRAIEVEVPTTLVYDYPTIAAISEMIIRQLPATPESSKMLARQQSTHAAIQSENVAPQAGETLILSRNFSAFQELMDECHLGGANNSGSPLVYRSA